MSKKIQSQQLLINEPVFISLTGRLDFQGFDGRVADRSCNAVREALVDSSPHRHYETNFRKKDVDSKKYKNCFTLPRLDFWAFDILEMSRHVLNVSFPFLVVPNLAP